MNECLEHINTAIPKTLRLALEAHNTGTLDTFTRKLIITYFEMFPAHSNEIVQAAAKYFTDYHAVYNFAYFSDNYHEQSISKMINHYLKNNKG